MAVNEALPPLGCHPFIPSTKPGNARLDAGCYHYRTKISTLCREQENGGNDNECVADGFEPTVLTTNGPIGVVCRLTAGAQDLHPRMLPLRLLYTRTIAVLSSTKYQGSREY